MKIYILSAHEYSDWTMLGIYSSRELADAAKEEYERSYDPPSEGRANDIQVVELDPKITPK